MTWASIRGFVDPLGCPAATVAGGKVASHVIISRATPQTAAARRATPSTSAVLMPDRPSTRSQSATGDPAIELKTSLKGPAETPDRNPAVGDPPLTHAFALGVA